MLCLLIDAISYSYSHLVSSSFSHPILADFLHSPFNTCDIWMSIAMDANVDHVRLSDCIPSLFKMAILSVFSDRLECLDYGLY